MLSALPWACYVAVDTNLGYAIILSNEIHTWMTSKLRRVCQRERGRSVKVMSSPSSWGGVENTSTGASFTVSAVRASRTRSARV